LELSNGVGRKARNDFPPLYGSISDEITVSYKENQMLPPFWFGFLTEIAKQKTDVTRK